MPAYPDSPAVYTTNRLQSHRVAEKENNRNETKTEWRGMGWEGRSQMEREMNNKRLI